MEGFQEESRGIAIGPEERPESGILRGLRALGKRVWEIAKATQGKVLTVLSGGVVGTLGLAAVQEGEAKADIVSDFAAENLQPLNEFNEGAINVPVCTTNLDSTLLRVYRILSYSPFTTETLEASVEPLPNDSIAIASPIEPMEPSPIDSAWGNMLWTTANGNEFRASGGSLYRNGELLMNPDYGMSSIYYDQSHLTFTLDMGRTRGFTVDNADVVIFPEDYLGPPLPIEAISDVRAVVTPLLQLNIDPPDPNEAYLENTVVFGFSDLNEPIAFVTKFCTRGVLSCLPPRNTEAGTDDIYMHNLSTGEDPVKVASTNTESEIGSCVLNHPNALCLFVSKGLPGNLDLYYVCHPRDNDSDGVSNWTDNCRNTPNSSQEDPDLDTIGSVCDNCPAVYNPDQLDSDGDNTGDACKIPPDGPPLDVSGDGPTDAGSEPPRDAPPPDVSGDAGPEPSPDAPSPDTSTPDAISDAPPQDTLPPPPDMGMDAPLDTKRDVSLDSFSPSDGGVPDGRMILPDRTLPPEDSWVSEERTPDPPSPGCSCALNASPAAPGVSLYVLAPLLLGILKRRKQKRELEKLPE